MPSLDRRLARRLSSSRGLLYLLAAALNGVDAFRTCALYIRARRVWSRNVRCPEKFYRRGRRRGGARPEFWRGGLSSRGGGLADSCGQCRRRDGLRRAAWGFDARQSLGSPAGRRTNATGCPLRRPLVRAGGERESMSETGLTQDGPDEIAASGRLRPLVLVFDLIEQGAATQIAAAL